jgi:hypothetical protein
MPSSSLVVYRFATEASTWKAVKRDPPDDRTECSDHQLLLILGLLVDGFRWLAHRQTERSVTSKRGRSA